MSKPSGSKTAAANAMPNDICLWCYTNRKDPNKSFCSDKCTMEAGDEQPQLIPIPKGHVLYEGVKKSRNSGLITPKEYEIRKIYLVTRTNESRAEYEKYRKGLEDKGNFVAKGKAIGNEVKRFRGADRACYLGEENDDEDPQMCIQPECKLCQSLIHGFGPYLHLKRTQGLALKYANTTPDIESDIRVLMLCKVALGRAYETWKEHQTWDKPPDGYDSVHAMTTPDKAGKKSVFKYDERVVYTEKAMRPAYVVAVKRVEAPSASKAKKPAPKPRKKIPGLVRYKNTKKGRPGLLLRMLAR
ncbi:hypothetical protein TOPH_00014 [Tolypocladium ophioglossoides CBS 100239]|uniref:PARP catalytic domain-containing protein n=1 Tax=Tolypocladium ophioglossoides (strain CBS 100239) TaxID=1163406 RepID=A0A0L0NLF1_TOLOC|nr:hypothetical protein TOPH_00014 [Tolypocladium ophioglossoides CBS 100239]